MRFKRDTIEFEADLPGLVDLGGRLQPGRWTIEGARGVTPGRPPIAHRPGSLLGSGSCGSGLAISLRTSTLLRLDIGVAVVAWLGAAGHAVAPLAGVALHEILVNAAVHGNLGVPSGPSASWSDLDIRDAAIAAALEDPHLAGRFVTVALRWGGGEVVAIIADEGAGYRRAMAVPARRAPLRAAGNGLRIAREAGRVAVARNGRRTTLTFHCIDAQKPDAVAGPFARTVG